MKTVIDSTDSSSRAFYDWLVYLNGTVQVNETDISAVL